MQLLHRQHMEPSKARARLCSAHSQNILMGMHLEKGSVQQISTSNTFSFWLLSKSHRNRGEVSSLFYVHLSLFSSDSLLSVWILCFGSQFLQLSTWRVWGCGYFCLLAWYALIKPLKAEVLSLLPLEHLYRVCWQSSHSPSMGRGHRI